MTTAATMWLTAALGIACGLAAWNLIAVAMIFALVALVGIYWLETAYARLDVRGKKARG